MEALVFVAFLIICFVFVFPLVAMARSGRALREIEVLRGEWNAFRQWPQRGPLPPGRENKEPEMPASVAGSPARPAVVVPAPVPVAPAPPLKPMGDPPPAHHQAPEVPLFAFGFDSSRGLAERDSDSGTETETEATDFTCFRPLNLEQFLGVRMFAWVGGLALFLGVVFFVKYAFDQNLIPPAVRTAMGFLTGLALTTGGLWLHRKGTYAVMSRTLCATGMLVLYGVTFAAHALYKFPFFSAVPTFLLMALITAVSFLLAVRLKALEVAFLGMLGGFLAPVLCSTGQDNPLALFTSTALLDIGLLAVARRCRWPFLAAFAALGTLITQFGWVGEFFEEEHYAHGLKTWTVAAVFLVFPALFTAALGRKKDAADESRHYAGGSALLLLGGAMVHAFAFLGHPSIADRPGLLLGFVFLIQALVMAVAWARPALRKAVAVFGVATFIHLLLWTAHSLTPALLPWALAAYLILGLGQIGFLLACERWQGGGPEFRPVMPWIPAAIQLLTLVPVVRLAPVPFMVWPFILGVNLLAVVLAARCRRMLPVLGAGAVTLLNALIWLSNLPSGPASMAVFLPTLTVFSLTFLAATLWAGKQAEPREKELARWLPALSAGMPFLLLMVAVGNMELPDPTPVFAVALLLASALLWLSRRKSREPLAVVALNCVVAVEALWHLHSFDRAAPAVPLAWYLGLHLFFAAWPFAVRRQLEGRVLPWAVSAVSGIGHFLLVYALMRRAWPEAVNGLLPLAFSLPPLLGLAAAHRGLTLPGTARIPQLAWFGGVALFFITLAVPIHFRREWITLGWALEGAALCWLFRRVPHPGLKLTGLALLTVSFVRMGLNPLIFQYHEITGRPLLNWHLYGYGLTAAAQFAGAWLLVPPHHRWREIPVRAALCAFGGILLFMLVNVEIADWFTPPGHRFITFRFHGNFARDMVTSIAWGLFALGLMIIGFRWRQSAARYAGVGLLVVTLLKLFLHDLAQLGTVHRIGAFIAVALTALVASFLYQRFLNAAPPAAGNSTDPPEAQRHPASDEGKGNGGGQA
ncbi:MAG: DUF2339 domain-containing protein [Verrucomicrobiota bacterium]